MPTLEQDIVYLRKEIRAWHARTDLPYPGVPFDMRVDPKSEEEWQAWRAVDSTYTIDSILELEQQLPAPLPPFFHAYILACHTLGMDFGEYHLPESRSDRSLATNFSTLLESSLWEAGYMQFGRARGCGDPLCFDFQSPTAAHDYPIVVFNHDVVPSELLSDRNALGPYRADVAGSFREFFDLLLSRDNRLIPVPISPEEQRRNAAWEEVNSLLDKQCLPRHYRPEGVSPSDPWAIAEFLRNL